MNHFYNVCIPTISNSCPTNFSPPWATFLYTDLHARGPEASSYTGPEAARFVLIRDGWDTRVVHVRNHFLIIFIHVSDHWSKEPGPCPFSYSYPSQVGSKVAVAFKRSAEEASTLSLSQMAEGFLISGDAASSGESFPAFRWTLTPILLFPR